MNWSSIDSGVRCSSASFCRNYLLTKFNYVPKNGYSCRVGIYGYPSCHFSRWDTAIPALIQAIKDYGGTAVKNYQDRKVRFGLIMFSHYSTLSAPIYRDPPTLINILATTRASGGTRYDRAFTTAMSELRRSFATDVLKNRKTGILFVTDGYPNEGCSRGPAIVDQIYKMKDANGKPRNIKTYAVGFGQGLGTRGEQCLAYVSRMGRTYAKRCNTGRCLYFYAADSYADLADAFQDIINQTTQEICDGLDNDCDGQIDNNASGDCSCVKSFTAPVSTSSVSPQSQEYRKGVRLYTFLASFDVQGCCGADCGNPGAKKLSEKYLESCRNNPQKAVYCRPNKNSQPQPDGAALQLMCKRCCATTPNSQYYCKWPSTHYCSNFPWGTRGNCQSMCKTWCQTNQPKAVSCIVPQGVLKRSGVGYDRSGKLTPLSVKDFSLELARQVKNYNPPRWLFINLPNIEHRLRLPSARPKIVEVSPNNWFFPTRAGSSWNRGTGSGWTTRFDLSPTNPNLTPQLFGIIKDLDRDGTNDCGTTSECKAEVERIIYTLIGKNPRTGTIYRHRPLGAIYHSVPAVSSAPKDIYDDPNYKRWLNTPIAAGSQRNKKVKDRPSVLYIGTNDGILHAFSAETGFELWGVIPATVIPKLANVPHGSNPDGSRLYTVDGTPLVMDVQVWRKFNSKGEAISKWMTVLIVGFRAGGRGYLAIDVTNPYAPRILWEINNNSYYDPNNPRLGRFANLGYTFAQPFIANVTVNCSAIRSSIPGCSGIQERAVVIMPGGIALKKKMGRYLIDQNSTAHAYIYAVDLESGKLIRAFKIDSTVVRNGGRGFASTPVGYGIPPAITTRVFIGDVLGRLFRIDLNNSDPSRWSVKHFFSLFSSRETPMPIMAGLNAAFNNRGELVIFGGTGDIENPNFITGFNKIFSIREKIYYNTNGQVSAVKAIPNFIFKLNKYLNNENSTTAKPGPEVTINSSRGEKLTGTPVIFNGTAYFTTYIPSVDLPVCGVPGYARVYGIHFNDQCRTPNCANLLAGSSRHFYHGYLARVNKSVTPIRCCEKDGRCNSGSSAPPDDNSFLSNPNLCGDLSYTVPMLRYTGTAAPYEYYRYLSLGANTMVMGATYSYAPGEVNVTTITQKGKTSLSIKSVRPATNFISFRVAGRNPASSTNFKLQPMRAVQINSALKDANFTTVKSSDTTPPISILSWGAVLDE